MSVKIKNIYFEGPLIVHMDDVYYNLDKGINLCIPENMNDTKHDVFVI